MDQKKSESSTNGTPDFGFLEHHLTNPSAYQFAIIITRFEDHWVFVRHAERDSWELPAGHVENHETVYEAAHRELYEETGALCYSLESLVSYYGKYKGNAVTGMVFVAQVTRFGSLPDFEIAEMKLFSSIPDNLTYPLIQPQMIAFYLNN